MSPRYPYDPPEPAPDESSPSTPSSPSPPNDPSMDFYSQGSLAEEAQYASPSSGTPEQEASFELEGEASSQLSAEIEALRKMGGGRRAPSAPPLYLPEASTPYAPSRTRRKAAPLPSATPTYQSYVGGDDELDYYPPPAPSSPGPDAAEDRVSFAQALVSLCFVGLASVFLFSSGFSLHAKLHFFTLFLFIYLLIYNWKTYVSPEIGESVFDSYAIFVTNEEGIQTEVGRGGKWWRLVFSFREPPRPDCPIDAQSDTDVESFSWRTFYEWIVLSIGVFWCWSTAYQYYWRQDGPYLHDIMGVFLSTLFFAALPWGLGWLRRRLFLKGEGLRQHTEALNFLLWRWLLCYLLMWIIAFFIMLDD